jgi:hypothetical protein
MDGPEGKNGIRLHYEVMLVMRQQKKKLREFDLRADTREAAEAKLAEFFPGYTCVGSWAEAIAKAK